MKKILTSLAFLAFGLSSDAQILWRVCGNGLDNPSYIFGSHHLCPGDFCHTVYGFDEAFACVDCVVGELDLIDIQPLQMMELGSYMALPEGVELSSLFCAEDWDFLYGELRSLFGSQIDEMMGLKPMAISVALQNMIAARTFPQIAGQTSLDEYIQRLACRASKKISGLETFAYQADLLYNTPLEKQAEELLEMVRDGNQEELLTQITEAYRGKNLENIWRLFEESFEEDDYLRLVKQRNIDWADKMASMMAESATMFVVGAGHLPGEDGILALLSKMGYDVVPVTPQEGVSSSLARWRATHFSDVKYDLFFNIPDFKEGEITGSVSLSFKSDLDAGEAILDFKGAEEDVHKVLLNGESCDFMVCNEHIVVRNLPKGENTIYVEFVPASRPLNRRDGFLFTLLVPDRARLLFPSFDQPDIKGHFSLELEIPSSGKAVSNSVKISEQEVAPGRVRVSFDTTEELSTYLFSFVAGHFEVEEFRRGERSISIYHRENDPKKIKQLPDIAGEVFDALEFLEEYTAIPYPFGKYDLIILPGFQYGGMEHTGATLYNDTRMFLNEQATLAERLARSSLIAHETAHMWFGDYVTMKWFDDVWTKEVFANYFASRIVSPHYKGINHHLNFVTDYLPSAYTEDRTDGANSVKQQLDNLADAGLVYGNIIYNKSPMIMEMLVRLLGEEKFRDGIREYLSSFGYANATWEDLIDILDGYSDMDLKEWSHSWVCEGGMPVIEHRIEDGEIVITQSDPTGKGVLRSQEITYLVNENPCTVFLEGKCARVPLPQGCMECDDITVIPNSDARGYGFFKVEGSKGVDDLWKSLKIHNTKSDADEVLRASVLMTLYENVRSGDIQPSSFVLNLLKHIEREENEILFNLALKYLSESCRCYYDLSGEFIGDVEASLWKMVSRHRNRKFRLSALRSYISVASTEAAMERLYIIWNSQKAPAGCTLGERDYTAISYKLAIFFEDNSKMILEKQRSRISNPDRIREFDFVSRGASSSIQQRRALFESLLLPENRVVEPWVGSALSLLNHPLRQKEALEFIRPALSIIEEIQKTGDIFFPTLWLKSLLGGHTSAQAYKIVSDFLERNNTLSEKLRNKILHQSFHLKRFSAASGEGQVSR